MKAGTTTLFRWLGEQPEVELPAIKEPDFFSYGVAAGSADVAGYAALFPSGSRLTGEASVSYTDPAVAAQAAARIVATLPEARLIFVMRHPLERARSHYRHEVQRGRERAPFGEAIQRPDSPYVRRSLYSQGIAPYLESCPRDLLLLVRFEDLVGATAAEWDRVVDHLGLEPRPRPNAAYNITAAKSGYRSPLRWLWERGFDQQLSRAPGWARRIGRTVLLRDGRRYRELMATSDATFPASVAAALWEDAAYLQELLGSADPIWDGSAPESDSRNPS